MGALAPLGKVAGRKKDWLVEVTIYTLAGLATSTLVGSTLAWLGGWLLPEQVNRSGLIVAIVVAVVAAARELKWISFPLPQLKRQTKDYWGKFFPGKIAAMLWGFDLGLIFTTYLTFAGVWLLAILAVLMGDPISGVLVFGLYWLGRTLSVWLAPLLMPNAGATPQVIDAIYSQYPLFQRIHVIGLVWAIIVLTLWLAK